MDGWVDGWMDYLLGWLTVPFGLDIEVRLICPLALKSLLLRVSLNVGNLGSSIRV